MRQLPAILISTALLALAACKVSDDPGATALNGVWMELAPGHISGQCVRLVAQRMPWLPVAQGYSHLAGGVLTDCASGANPGTPMSGLGASPYAARLILDLYVGTDTATYHYDLTQSSDILTGTLTDPTDTLAGTSFRVISLATGAVAGLYGLSVYQAPAGVTPPTDSLDLEAVGSVAHYRVVSGAGCFSQNVGEYAVTGSLVIVRHYYSPAAAAACRVAARDSLSIVAGQLVRRIIRPNAADTTKRDTILETYTRQ
jgi:hypothetical protein